MQWVSKLSFKQKKEQKDFAVVVVVADVVAVVVDAAFVASQLLNIIFKKKINIFYLSM